MRHLMVIWKNLISATGTIAINVMDVFEKGSPTLSPYVERFTLSAIDDVGLHLAGRMIWHSPTKLGNIEWTSKRKVHPKNQLEHVLLFSKTASPAWDITRMDRKAYAAGTVRQEAAEVARGRRVRPSGLNLNGAAFKLGDGPLPGNIIVSGGATGSDIYSRRARAAGADRHPARFPEALPRQVIQLATDVGDVCYDPMAGSNTTGKVASELGRRFISSDPMLEYVRGSALRFDQRSDFRMMEVGR
jgi:site-specific DNA-methyltransferase (cytosine-N4-specific)